MPCIRNNRHTSATIVTHSQQSSHVRNNCHTFATIVTIVTHSQQSSQSSHVRNNHSQQSSHIRKVAYDEASADAGALLQAGFLGLLAAEALVVLGIKGSPSSVVVATHSGGYRAAAAAALVGWSPHTSPVRELWLFDSL
jgi:hypothetical protein